MTKILEDLQCYVTSRAVSGAIPVHDGEDIQHTDEVFHRILLGGDQLTCARVRGAQAIRCNQESSSTRLEGFIDTCEDWHAKVILLKVNTYIRFNSLIMLYTEYIAA